MQESFVYFKGTSDSIARAVSEEFCSRSRFGNRRNTFVYFKVFKPISWDERPAERPIGSEVSMIFKPKSWDKRPAERRCRLIQRFPSARIFRAIPTCIFPALWYNRKASVRVQRSCLGGMRHRVQRSCLGGMRLRV